MKSMCESDAKSLASCGREAFDSTCLSGVQWIRTLLGDDTFNDCIWLTYNLSPLHLVNYDRFVKAWKKDGTQRMGIFKGAEAAGPDDPNSASQVVRRHLSATSPSPLYHQ